MQSTALWFSGPRQAELRKEKVDEPGPGEVLVKSVCSLISSGTELNFYRGTGRLDGMTGLMFGTLPFPIKFGYQQIGRILAAGPGSRFSPGDLVFCRYPHQDIFVVAESGVYAIPDGLTPERAAFANLFCVALNCLLTAPALIGDYVAVSGLGIVGVFASYLSSRTAAGLVLVDPNPRRRQIPGFAKPVLVLDPSESEAAIKTLTDGRGVDLFIEASGAPAGLQLALNCTGHEGTISVPSWYGSRPAELVLSPEFHMLRQKIISTGPWQPAALSSRWNRQRTFGTAFNYLKQMDLESFVQIKRVPFEEAPSAYKILDDSNCEFGAVILVHDD
jgi:2-desacetyl-2-hydroxyethyl bacteriochlorophyllide A dehydrogenase